MAAARCPMRSAGNRAIHPDGYADPLDGFRRLYFDTVLFEPQALRFLCDVAGSDRVVLGSDYPFPIGDPEPARVVDETPLTQGERQPSSARPLPGSSISIAAVRTTTELDDYV